VNLKPWHIAIVLLAAGVAVSGWIKWKCDHDPEINLLPHDGRYRWIIFPSAIDARSHPVAWLDTTFRRRFNLGSQPKRARLDVGAAKRLELKINGELVELPPARNWKEISTADVSKFLRSGENTIEARVFNDDAPPALWCVLTTDTNTWRSNLGWEASLAGSSWRNCAFVSVPRKPGPGNLLFGGERISDALPRIWLAWIGFAIITILFVAIVRRIGETDADLAGTKLVIAIGVCVIAWGILFWHNAKLLPFLAGYDFKDHIAYIKYIQERGALPLPTQGYEMFQPPLFYAVAAALLSILHLSTADAAAVPTLRALTMLFGIANFVFVFLSARLLFPRRPLAQLVALITAAFLPMQLYLSHYVTNETLAATLATMSIYFALRVLLAERTSFWQFAIVGVPIGAGMLAKSTSLLLIPPVIGAIAIRLLQQRAGALRWVQTLGSTIAVMLAMCGWHYLRIWRHFGTPIIGNWDSRLGFPWWQDPGVHTLSDYLRFGQSLVSPAFSGFNGFADGIYSTLWGDSLGGGLSGVLSRTPWNYHLIAGGYWLAIIPTALVLIGAVIALLRFARRISAEWFLLIGFSGAIAVAEIFMTLRVASYAQVKAFYGLAGLVPFCAFAVLGWSAISERSRTVRLGVLGFLIFFGINNFASVWIRQTTEYHIYAALRLITDSKNDRAVAEATEAVKSGGANHVASYVLAAVLDEAGESQKAIDECERCIERNLAAGECHLQLAIGLAKRGELSGAINEARRALELLPENARVHDLVLALHGELHRNDEAIAAARDALVVSPFDANLHYRFGLAAGQAGEFAIAANQIAYAVSLDPKKTDYQQKLRIALSFLAQTPNATTAIKNLESIATGSPKLLEILAPYRQNPNSTP
jgi:tetratricopeptide (TPR) repeat protein